MNVGGIDLVGFLSAMLSAGLVAAVPLVVAALGEAVGERAGLLNLGIEGMMLAGAFFGFLAAYQTESAVAGMAAGIVAGMALGLLFGFLTITLRVDQVIVGLAITIFGGGLTAFLYRDVFAGQNPSAEVATLTITIPVLSDIPIVGPAVFQGQLLFYLAYACVPVFAFLLARTRFGLNVRAVGENPFAADAAGVSVTRVRYAAILIAGGMAGAAGAFLSVADLKIFQVGMTVGMGFIALALTMVGGWNPWRILIAAVLFGMLRSLGNGLQILGIDIRTEFITMLPYLGVMLALVLLAGRTALPAALGIPYARGRR
ncbi:MAG TPA: ABC transporter permease [Thermomicrobiales bacterium]|nr:ABC transporter permease [Thermomicrobiales bacterium]